MQWGDVTLLHISLSASGRHGWSVPAKCPLGRPHKGERVEDMTLGLCLRSAGAQLQRVRRKQGVASALRQCSVSRSNECTDVAGRRRTRSGQASGRRASQPSQRAASALANKADDDHLTRARRPRKGLGEGPKHFQGQPDQFNNHGRSRPEA